MVVLEKWIPKKPISAIYFDGEKSAIIKRFW
jgi:topoisomerase-4 subunit A